ncbi:MAG: hypothetical protein Q9220_006716 [cf. Caloplaca sp. 1 TL-2023]
MDAKAAESTTHLTTSSSPQPQDPPLLTNPPPDETSDPLTPATIPPSTPSTLKDRIRHHYNLASDYYYSLWGEHIHHGLFLTPTDTKELAQLQLIELLLERSELERGSKVLDVGCGIGGTARFLAREWACEVVGVTISGRQVEIAERLTRECVGAANDCGFGEPIQLGNGSVQFMEADAEKMADIFPPEGERFDYIWITEALSHLSDKQLFFHNAFHLLRRSGKVVIADWFKAEGLSEREVERDIKPIEEGMLLPPLCTQNEYIAFAAAAGLGVFTPPLDISDNVARTW